MKKFTKEELETTSYTDIAYYILEDKPKKTKEIFEKICKLYNFNHDNYVDKIGDFYTSLTTDKRFILLDGGKWDLKHRHTLNVVVDEDDDIEDNQGEVEIEEEIIEEEEENLDTAIDDDYDEEELKDLYVINEDELE